MNKVLNSIGVMISGMDFLCLNIRDMKIMMIISVMEEVISVFFFICCVLYIFMEGFLKYLVINWGCFFFVFCSLFLISWMSLLFLFVFLVLNIGVMNISRVELFCEKICLLISL